MKKFKTRQEYIKAIDKKGRLIHQLIDEVEELKKDALRFSDEKQWFEVKEEERVVYRFSKISQTKKSVVAKVHWIQDYVDSDTGEIAKIPRSKVVAIDGEWIDLHRNYLILTTQHNQNETTRAN